MKSNRTPRRIVLSMLGAASLLAAPASASILDYVGECVPFARQASGIQIWGDAWTWWGQAQGKYQRGDVPEVGAVVAFAKSNALRLGHVSVVSRIIEPRVIMVTHANWSRFDGKRGQVEQDVTLFDVSPAGDWSQVKVWYRDTKGLGSTTYPVHGFIYGRPASGAKVARARPAPELTGDRPDYVGSLIDAYAR
ncbi:CHAP domain-containing protein [Sphingomonas koreensis]|jgi:surface antigen|uniref:Amidase n=1 Tax=Sphingomonas koreensis TaxID=93064 RepID=A0A1L6JCC2_9SPHN|nr:CHAP domain-containing protein [Sphingomonas koreensis]APR53556.1 amidase [Sphingomonas koreensis]MDC7809725.1 CHAP domain-containing protein [Sphingomonas koreensis]PJI87092.1 CHAP domain-containing protein [Sphingomonas koreensis]RSU20986.1 CHAP domain-containing protein [Sphingomonas koreensis]RSU22087.1 CHAP domain-containing protein [Sphingomonas koreensis]